MSSFEKTLSLASEAWVADGLITAPQREAILARHPLTADSHASSRFLAILATIGGALLLIGVSLIIKANWAAIGDWVKIGALVALLLGAYIGGWRLKVSPGRYPRLGDACLMVGAVLFLLGIALVSQIFHLNSRPSNGVLLWWAGIAAVPWLVRAKGAYFVSIVAGLIWLGMEMHASDSVLLLASSWDRYSSDEFLFAAAGVFVGLALFASGLALRRSRFPEFSGIHEKLGLGTLTFSLYALGFTWQVSNWSHHTMGGAQGLPTALVIGLAVIAVCAAWNKRESHRTILLWLIPGLIPAFAHLVGIELKDSGWLWGGLACVSLFVFNFGMIRAGLESGRESWINLGIAGIALNILTRYFLLFGTMLEGGMFFIITGLVVIGLGYGLERKRRALVRELRKEVAS